MSKNTAPDCMETMLTRSKCSHTVLLTSFRHNGQGVRTPVGMMAVEGKLYFMTPASSWKARRIARTLDLLASPGGGYGSTSGMDFVS